MEPLVQWFEDRPAVSAVTCPTMDHDVKTTIARTTARHHYHVSVAVCHRAGLFNVIELLQLIS